eukprot:1996911-Pyramimonas_sp.AAC.1
MVRLEVTGRLGGGGVPALRLRPLPQVHDPFGSLGGEGDGVIHALYACAGLVGLVNSIDERLKVAAHVVERAQPAVPLVGR